MLVLILNAFSVLGISQAFLFSKSDVCISEEVTLSCRCKQRENVTLTAFLNFEIKRIIIEGCGFVSVPLGAMSHLQLENISFIDIYQLDILPFALVGVQEIQDLRIENIREFKVRQHGFVGLYNVSNVIIRNVTSETLTVGAFGGVSNVQNFLIENSSFDEIQETAFLMTNITNFTISGCKFRSLQNISVLVHNAESVTFENCDIEETKNNTFSMSFVESLSFINCRFGTFASTSVLSKSLKMFTFNQCTVEILETDAFTLVDASEKIVFTHNVIKLADEYSLIPSTGTFNSKNVKIEDCCNYFTCDCSIHWMWEPDEDLSYNSLLKNSFCIQNPETKLSNLEFVLDSSKNCMTLEPKIFHHKIKPSDSFETSTSLIHLNSSKTLTYLKSGQANTFELQYTILKILLLCILCGLFV